jgi:hypothetical protein
MSLSAPEPVSHYESLIRSGQPNLFRNRTHHSYTGHDVIVINRLSITIFHYC